MRVLIAGEGARWMVVEVPEESVKAREVRFTQ